MGRRSDEPPQPLEWEHRLTLRMVDRGVSRDTPARRTLVAIGLVEQRPDGSYAITRAGRDALDPDARSRRARWQRIAVGVAGVCGGVLVVGSLVEWLT